ncbi:hypothetical protein BDB00DRAFT_872660 [Zychaea mexicana]|uniref:uncharacterized protein n=1 Tax=Zychaea mexicana TaxID=64656 RepID=UPI0022FDE219|nr:uncharacterized protein BDB00DRAFT_872660 [Zychaea mexicana]KAI9493144.1 hypothetical protein BDB00DRAFT_872660 [Zychaea mexicana]
MKIYRAETGRHVRWSSQNATIDSLEQFKRTIEESTGVPIDCQILMTSFGTQVKASQLEEVITATGDKEYLVFVYDRHYLNATEDEVNKLLDLETPSLEQKVPPFDEPSSVHALARAKGIAGSTLSDTCQLYLELFGSFDAYSQILIQALSTHARLSRNAVEEQKMQSMAINVAMTNLESHSYMANQNVGSFSSFAEKELATQSSLVETTEINLTILQNIRVHPEIMRSIVNPSTAMTAPEERLLIHFIDTVRIDKAKNGTRELCTSLGQELQELHDLAMDINRYEKDLQKQITEDQDLHSLDAVASDIQEILQKAQFLREKIKRDLSRVHSKISELLHVPVSFLAANNSNNNNNSIAGSGVIRDQGSTSALGGDFGSYSGSPTSPTLTSHAKKTLEAFSHLAEIHVNDYLPKLHAYETSIRQKVVTLVLAKRKSIEQFLENMGIVSQLQSEIAAVAPRIEDANKWISDFQAERCDGDLEALQEVIFAYGYLLIEVVRRKEYNTILAEGANAIADLLAGYRTEETKRREDFVRNILKSLPFEVKDIENESTTHCEVSTINSQQSKLDITRKDIIDFIRILGQYYGSSHVQSTSRSPKSSNRISFSNILGRGSSPSDNFRRISSTKQAIQQSSITRGTDKFVDLLHVMSQQLDGLRAEFFKAMEATFFSSITDNPASEYRGSPLSKERSLLTFNSLEIELRQKTKALNVAEEKAKKYEARIAALEKTLEKKSIGNVLANNNDAPSSLTLSAYSVVEDGSSGRQSAQSVPHRFDTTNKEVDQLREIVREQEDLIASLQKQLHNEQNQMEIVKEQNEHEKEDLRLQVQELEQLLEEERQTYEDNRKSLLKEAQIKDNLADIRIASVEGDWRAKLQELQTQIDQQHLESQNHNVALEQTHQDEIDRLQSEYKQRIKKLLEEASESKAHNSLLESENAQIRNELEKLSLEYKDYRAYAEKEMKTAEQRLEQLDDTEQARDEIKQQLAKTRDMVTRAENDWMSKHQALEEILQQRRNTHNELVALIVKYGRPINFPVGEEDIETLLDILKESLETFATGVEATRQKLQDLEQDHGQVASRMAAFDEERLELYATATQMAEKLEEFRKGIFYELTNQLQLSVDEEEARAMTKKLIITGGQDDLAVWTRVLQAVGSVDSDKFVERIRTKVRDAHDLTRRWKREYKDLREKYNKVSSSGHDKIAFRNFQIGDVALFLPTRNSTGKPWAAFNINAPHYFLKPSNSVAQQMNTREWLVARITSITEHTVTVTDPQSNPYGLSEGLTYFHLEVEHWKSNRQRKSKKISSSSKQANASTTTSFKGKESENLAASTTSTAFSKSYTTSAPDTGLASISPDTQRSSEPYNGATASALSSSSLSSPNNLVRPPFPMSLSSSSVVHSYVPPSSPPNSVPDRRHSTGVFTTQQQQQHSLSRSQQLPVDSTMMWTQAHQ